jgi:hypothetical protein
MLESPLLRADRPATHQLKGILHHGATPRGVDEQEFRIKLPNVAVLQHSVRPVTKPLFRMNRGRASPALPGKGARKKAINQYTVSVSGVGQRRGASIRCQDGSSTSF